MLKVLFHSYGKNHCPDGFSAAYAAWKKLGDSAEYIPVQYQESPEAYHQYLSEFIKEGDEIYMVDWSCPKEVLEHYQTIADITILDHHKTAKEGLEGIKGTKFAVTKCSAVMAWEYWHPGVKVPDLILYVQDRDLWNKSLPHTEEIHRALGSFRQIFDVWDMLATMPDYVEFMKPLGEKLLGKHLIKVHELCKTSEMAKLDGYEIYLTKTNNYSLVSEALNKLASSQHVDFAVNVYYADGFFNYQLRSVGDFDVSEIAKLHGGGGHKNAAGFKHVEDLIKLY